MGNTCSNQAITSKNNLGSKVSLEQLRKNRIRSSLQLPGDNHMEKNRTDHSQMDEAMLRQKIEELRVQLHRLVQKNGFADSSVVRLSQELDIYIVQLQQIMIRHNRLI